AVDMLGGGISRLKNIRFSAIMRYVRTLKKANAGEYAVAMYNYAPYAVNDIVFFEFTMEKNSNKSLVPLIKVYDENDNILPSQVVKEDSNVSIDCRKRIAVQCDLKPLDISRLRVTTELVPAPPPPPFREMTFSIKTPFYTAEINQRTGYLSKLEFGRKNYLKSEGFGLFIYEDNEDPWAMSDEQLKKLGKNIKRVSLDNFPRGVFEGLRSINVIEDGELLKRVEAVFYHEQSSFAIDYIFYKTKPVVEVKIKAFFLSRNKIIKLHIPLANYGKLIGQQVFGQEELSTDGRECVAQRYVSFGTDDRLLGIFNNSSYACSFYKDDLMFTLLRSATYCAHPVDDEPIVKYDRYLDLIDMGERDFTFRFTECKRDDLERLASEMNEPPYALALFPTGDMSPCDNGQRVVISNKNITLSAMKKRLHGGETLLRLFNGTDKSADCVLTVGGVEKQLSFGAFEVKTVGYNGKTLDEKYYMEI
ncbi:MAG: hypothetical protein IJS67_00530, partial [Clostridia bacterium]|nr:hypothetical protein [Clostridia bacterium]